MVDTMEKKRTRTLVNEALYNKAKPIVDVFSGQQDKYKTKTLFREAGAEFVSMCIGQNISASTFERMMKSTDFNDYSEISKKANPHTKKIPEAEDVQEPAAEENFLVPPTNLTIPDSVFVNGNTKSVDDVWKQLYIEPSDFASTIGEQVVRTGVAVSCIKKEVASMHTEVVKEIKEADKTNTAFLDDLTTTMCDIRKAMQDIVTELSLIRISSESLLKEWRGESRDEENKEESK